MDMATDLRSRMAAKRTGVAEVADLVGRTRQQVTRYRSGEAEIPRDVWQILLQHDLLGEESILGRDEVAQPKGPEAA